MERRRTKLAIVESQKSLMSSKFTPQIIKAIESISDFIEPCKSVKNLTK